jgi:hypothetical protein
MLQWLELEVRRNLALELGATVGQFAIGHKERAIVARGQGRNHAHHYTDSDAGNFGAIQWSNVWRAIAAAAAGNVVGNVSATMLQSQSSSYQPKRACALKLASRHVIGTSELSLGGTKYPRRYL